jgi:hypothetical protein
VGFEEVRFGEVKPGEQEQVAVDDEEEEEGGQTPWRQLQEVVAFGEGIIRQTPVLEEPSAH